MDVTHASFFVIIPALPDLSKPFETASRGVGTKGTAGDPTWGNGRDGGDRSRRLLGTRGGYVVGERNGGGVGGVGDNNNFRGGDEGTEEYKCELEDRDEKGDETALDWGECHEDRFEG
jgi:hypothetical protein